MDVVIQLNFYNYLNYQDYVTLISINKYFNNFINEHIYKYYIERKFSINFIKILEPYMVSYKDSFERIIEFEKKLYKKKYSIWKEQDYIIWNTKCVGNFVKNKIL